MGEEVRDRRAFAVTNLKSFDPTKEIQDGNDYLRSVIVGMNNSLTSFFYYHINIFRETRKV